MVRTMCICLSLAFVAGCLPTNIKGARSPEQIAACHKAGNDGRWWQMGTSGAALTAGGAAVASIVTDMPEARWGAAGAGLLAAGVAFYTALRGEHAARTARDCWEGVSSTTVGGGYQ